MRVLFNPGSGQDGDKLSAAQLRALLPRDARLCTPGAEALSRAARDAVAAGEELIVACGGDGTVNGVAAELVGSRCTLGVIPNGTLNHFARDAGIPLDAQEAVRVLQHGRTVRIDVGEVNGRVFLNNSSVGLYPSFVRARRVQQRTAHRGRWQATLRALWHILKWRRVLRLRIEANGAVRDCRTSFLFVGNNRYTLSGTRWSRERLDEGALSLITANEPGRLHLPSLLARAALGLLERTPDVTVAMTTSAVVRTRRRALAVALDGELMIMPTPLRYRILPHALALRVPAPESTEG